MSLDGIWLQKEKVKQTTLSCFIKL